MLFFASFLWDLLWEENQKRRQWLSRPWSDLRCRRTWWLIGCLKVVNGLNIVEFTVSMVIRRGSQSQDRMRMWDRVAYVCVCVCVACVGGGSETYIGPMTGAQELFGDRSGNGMKADGSGREEGERWTSEGQRER